MAIRNISDLEVPGEGVVPGLQHGHHMVLLFRKTVLFAINKA